MTKWSSKVSKSNKASLTAAFLALVYLTCAQPVETHGKQSNQPKKVRVNGVELHYVEQGEGTAVLFVHGGLDDYRYWKSQMEPFSEKYHVVAYSRRYNYPNNNARTQSDHSAIVEADDLAALIKTLRLGRVHIIGASYGAFTALFLALRHPEIVRSLVLAEAPVLRLAQLNPHGMAAYEELMTKLWKPAGAAFRTGDREQALKLTVEFFAGEGAFEQAPENLRQGWRDNLAEWQALTTSSNAFPELSRADIKRIKASVLMLSGERTLAIHKLIDDEVRCLLRHVDRLIIPNASHDMWSEYPEACTQAALAFLAKH